MSTYAVVITQTGSKRAQPSEIELTVVFVNYRDELLESSPALEEQDYILGYYVPLRIW